MLPTNKRQGTHTQQIVLSLSHANTHVHVYVIRAEEHIGVLGCFWDIRAEDTFILLTKTSNCFDRRGTVKEQGTICGHFNLKTRQATITPWPQSSLASSSFLFLASIA
jgi:hypothetical protein